MSPPAAPSAPDRLNTLAGVASVTVAFVLVALKLWALWSTGALSVAASLADSALDLAMSVTALAAILYAQRPADEDHSFGHSSAEDLAALGQSVVIIGAAGALAVAAGLRLTSDTPRPLTEEGVGIAVMAVSASLTLGLVLWQGHVARRTGNRVVAADRLHYVGDLLPTLGAILALSLSARYGVLWVDSVVALIAAGIMVVGALRIWSGAWNALMDRRADPDLEARIAQMVAGWPGVLGHHELRTRTAGSRIFLSIHIELDGRQSLAEAHAIAASLRRAIMEAHPRTEVIIHKDVADAPEG